MDFHHPLVQSLLLPGLLAFAASGLLRAALGPVEGRRWGACGIAVAIVGTATWVLGWSWPPGSHIEKMPWLYAASALLGVALQAARARPRVQWMTASLAWAVVMAGLGPEAVALKAAMVLAGAAVILAVLDTPPDHAHAATSLVVAGAGLAATAMLAGSALLFELGLAAAAAVAGGAVWLWPAARIALGASGAIVAVLAWLAVAQATLVSTPVALPTMLVLAGAFTAGPIVRRVRRRSQSSDTGATGASPTRDWIDVLLVAAIAALWVAAALALASWTGVPAAGTGDDPYYRPSW